MPNADSAPFAQVVFNIPDQATAIAICNAICPTAGLNLNAAKQAIVAWIVSQVIANQTTVANQTALASVVLPTPPTLT